MKVIAYIFYTSLLEYFFLAIVPCFSELFWQLLVLMVNLRIPDKLVALTEPFLLCSPIPCAFIHVPWNTSWECEIFHVDWHSPECTSLPRTYQPVSSRIAESATLALKNKLNGKWLLSQSQAWFPTCPHPNAWCERRPHRWPKRLVKEH